MDRIDYRIIVDRLGEADGGGHVAYVPDLPGCMSDGETDIQAVENLHDAIAAWIERARAMGRPIPRPTRYELPEHA